MALSNTWSTASEIYTLNKKVRDMNKLIYRDTNGFEAFVIGEDDKNYIIDDGNGCGGKVWKHTTKSKIKRVSSDYKLRKYVHKY